MKNTTIKLIVILLILLTAFIYQVIAFNLVGTAEYSEESQYIYSKNMKTINNQIVDDDMFIRSSPLNVTVNIGKLPPIFFPNASIHIVDRNLLDENGVARSLYRGEMKRGEPINLKDLSFAKNNISQTLDLTIYIRSSKMLWAWRVPTLNISDINSIQITTFYHELYGNSAEVKVLD